MSASSGEPRRRARQSQSRHLGDVRLNDENALLPLVHMCSSLIPEAFKHLRTRWRLSSFFVRLGSPLDALSLGAPPPCTGQPRLHPPGFLLFSSPCLARAAWLSSARRAWPSDALPVCVCAAGRLTASSRRRAHPAIYSSTSSPGLGAPADRLARALACAFHCRLARCPLLHHCCQCSSNAAHMCSPSHVVCAHAAATPEASACRV